MIHRLDVALTVASLGERYGGPSKTVTGLAAALVRNGLHVDIVYGHHERRDGKIVESGDARVGLHPTRVWPVGKRFRFYPGFGNKLVGLLRSGRCQLVHDNGLWLPCNWAAWKAARSFGVPYVLSPHGMVEPWALAWRAPRKRIALMLYQHEVLKGTAAFMATSAAEYESLRRLGLDQPVAVVPNGIDLELAETSPPAGLDKPDDRTRVVLFLSRIHPKKGIENLLQAWAGLDTRGWVLRIAGPDEDGYLDSMRRLAQRLGLAGRVEFPGAVSGEQKRETYRAADVFVLPAHTENFGVVVAEALAHGLPVITTTGTPWREIVEAGCGWWVDIGVPPLAAALGEAMGLSDRQRSLMGKRGQEYVRRYSWDAIARQTAEVYRWVLGRGDRPDFVHLD